MTAKRRVAVISADVNTRGILAAYLKEVGFEVEESSDLGVPGSFGALVLIGKDGSLPETLAARVRTWMKRTTSQRIVVVTSKPAALRDLITLYADRLFVLAAPAFGWDVVDVLRASEPGPRPRGA